MWNPPKHAGNAPPLPLPTSDAPYRGREAEPGSTSNSVIAEPSNSVIVLTLLLSHFSYRRAGLSEEVLDAGLPESREQRSNRQAPHLEVDRLLECLDERPGALQQRVHRVHLARRAGAQQVS